MLNAPGAGTAGWPAQPWDPAEAGVCAKPARRSHGPLDAQPPHQSTAEGPGVPGAWARTLRPEFQVRAPRLIDAAQDHRGRAAGRLPDPLVWIGHRQGPCRGRAALRLPSFPGQSGAGRKGTGLSACRGWGGSRFFLRSSPGILGRSSGGQGLCPLLMDASSPPARWRPAAA